MLQHTEMWEQLVPRVTDDELDMLQKVAVSVIAERDPKYELPKDERWYSNITFSHSRAIREVSPLAQHGCQGIHVSYDLLGVLPSLETPAAEALDERRTA